jgi:Uma2 family endonuclease
MDVDEYLRTSFEDAECEFLDGEVVDRNSGEWLHGGTLANIIDLLHSLRRRLGIRVVPIIRIRISPTRIRVADVAAWRGDNIGERIPIVPPFLAVEILSSQDRITRMLPKIQEYLAIGVEWVWVIDPEDKSALTFSRENPAGVACDVLRTANPDIEIPLAAAFDLDA